MSTDLSIYQDKLTALAKQMVYLQGQRDTQAIQSNRHLEAYKHCDVEIRILKEVIDYFSTTISGKIEEVQHTVEDLINKGLRYVFKQDEVGISLSTEFKNNKTQFIITLSDGQSSSTNMLDSFGGGLVAIVSFLFKVVISIIHKNERFMVFDETLNFVSASYQPALSQFIRQLCEDMGVTIVLVTHQPIMADHAHVVYEAFEAKGGSTKFKRLVNGNGEGISSS